MHDDGTACRIYAVEERTRGRASIILDPSGPT